MLTALTHFSIYFLTAVISLILFKLLYVKLTPYDEWKLIKDEKNIAAGIALSGAILGYAIAVGGVISNSVNYYDFLSWMLIAFFAQVVGFYIVRLVFMPKLVDRIKNNEVSAGVVLAASSVAIGILNAACVTY